MIELDFDKYIVVPWYATGSTTDGTRKYKWIAKFNTRGFNPSKVAASFPNTDEGAIAAMKLEKELTDRNEAF